MDTIHTQLAIVPSSGKEEILLSGACVILSRHSASLPLHGAMFLGTSFGDVMYVPYGPWPMRVTDTLAVVTVVPYCILQGHFGSVAIQ